MKRNHTLKKFYIVCLSLKVCGTRGPTDKYLKKISKIEKRIGLKGWSSNPHASWRYPHYEYDKTGPGRVFLMPDRSFLYTSEESSNEYSNKDSNEDSNEDGDHTFNDNSSSQDKPDELTENNLHPNDECAVCFEQFESINKQGESIDRACIIPCGHAQTCFSCLDKVVKEECPICKEKMSEYLRIYI